MLGGLLDHHASLSLSDYHCEPISLLSTADGAGRARGTWTRDAGAGARAAAEPEAHHPSASPVE